MRLPGADAGETSEALRGFVHASSVFDHPQDMRGIPERLPSPECGRCGRSSSFGMLTVGSPSVRADARAVLRDAPNAVWCPQCGRGSVHVVLVPTLWGCPPARPRRARPL